MITISETEKGQIQEAKKAPRWRWVIPRDWLLTLFILAVLVALVSLLAWIGGGTRELIDVSKPVM